MLDSMFKKVIGGPEKPTNQGSCYLLQERMQHFSLEGNSGSQYDSPPLNSTWGPGTKFGPAKMDSNEG